MKVRTFISQILFLSLVVFSRSDSAFAATELKIGSVDLQKALATCQAGKDAQKQYEAEVKKAQSKLDGKKGEYKKLQDSYEKQKDSLNAKAKGEKEEEILSTEKDLRRSFQDSQEQLKRKNDQIVGELVGKIRKVVESYGQSEGYSVIVERGGVSTLYVSPTLDVTDEVVKLFDEQGK